MYVINSSLNIKSKIKDVNKISADFRTIKRYCFMCVLKLFSADCGQKALQNNIEVFIAFGRKYINEYNDKKELGRIIKVPKIVPLI